MKNEMVWSRAAKTYLAPTSTAMCESVVEVTYQRVTIVSFYKGGRTFYGVTVQHPNDVDNKAAGVEQAMCNANIKPMMVIPGKETQSSFYYRANLIYELYEDKLEAVSYRLLDLDEWQELDPNAEPFADILLGDEESDSIYCPCPLPPIEPYEA